MKSMKLFYLESFYIYGRCDVGDRWRLLMCPAHYRGALIAEVDLHAYMYG